MQKFSQVEEITCKQNGPRERVPTFACIGFGSIAQKHVHSIRTMFPEAKIAVLTSQNIKSEDFGSQLFFSNALDDVLALRPDYCVIASPSTLHAKHFKPFLEIGTQVLIEKPVAATLIDAEWIEELALSSMPVPLVAYNIRFSAAFAVLRRAIEAFTIGEVLSVQSVVGQSLDKWRPNRPVSETVSASKKMGGGVMRELSHELDYLHRLFGDIQWAAAMQGRQKFIDFDVEDTAMLLLRYRGVNQDILASVNLDFTRHDTSRYCHVIGRDATLRWNLLAGDVSIYFASGKVENLFCDKDDLAKSNLKMWQNLVGQNFEPFASVGEAVSHIRWIETMQAECDNL